MLDASVLRLNVVGNIVRGSRGFLGGFLPHEWPRVVVPGLDPGADVGFEGLDALMDAAADQLAGQEPEPSLDLVDPRRTGGREVHVETGMAAQPRPDRGRLAGAVV